jgi:hypothetical protein
LIHVYDDQTSLYFKINNVYFVDCKSNPNTVSCGCIPTSNAGISGGTNVYFIRCSMKALLNHIEGDYKFSNYSKYLCSNSQNTIGSPDESITDGGNYAPKEKIEGLVNTIPFPHLAHIYGNSYVSFCPDMDISFTF